MYSTIKLNSKTSKFTRGFNVKIIFIKENINISSKFYQKL